LEAGGESLRFGEPGWISMALLAEEVNTIKSLPFAVFMVVNCGIRLKALGNK